MESLPKISYINDLEQWRSEFSFHIPIKIRFSETDMFGHVNNVSPFIYFEEGRIEFLKAAGVFGRDNTENGMPIVADLQCDYHKQLFFDDTLKLYVKVNHVGKTSLDIHYMAANEKDELCLTGRGRMVYINRQTGKPVSINESMKEKLINQ
ncbi:acyl-CoA thioesterase [Virgibacillus ihumii]|uniref:acyl-CoA thioesterase n=1 Tax=Virgibacillus ihumii TaxID=2686091 RepID=UPI003CCD53AF